MNHPIAQPFALNMRDVYVDAIEGLVRPPKSIMLPEWKLWNECVGGFLANQFTIFCGSTGSGKTTFLANVSAQLLKAKVKHFVMSVETGHVDYMTRILSVLEERDLNTGVGIRPEVAAAIHERHADLIAEGNIEFSLYDDRIPLDTLLADLHWAHYERGCQIAMIDNLNFFLEVTKAADAIIEMDRVVHELVIFAKRVPMHIILVMHPKKTDAYSKTGTKILDESQIRGSSLANQESSNIFFWNRPLKEDVESGERSQYDREFSIIKMRRRGIHVGKTIVFESRGTRFIEKGIV